jgi:hypothetical protein
MCLTALFSISCLSWSDKQERSAVEVRKGMLVVEWDGHTPFAECNLQIRSNQEEISQVRKWCISIRDYFSSRKRFVSSHHNLNRIGDLQCVAGDRWIHPGEKWQIKLSPGTYLLAREYWGGRDLDFMHTGFSYTYFEIKQGERVELSLSKTPAEYP